MSCNGCRILRKGCSSDCILRPCLRWISSPDSQANATLFLAKFYGRAGLLNLINAAPSSLHPEIFRSLLYEACGRIINPVYGSVGLICSGNWARCQDAVETVLRGGSIVTPDSAKAAASVATPIVKPVHGCDIRHLSKDSAARVRVQSHRRFKRNGNKGRVVSVDDSEAEMKFTITGWDCGGDDYERAPSHDSGSVETVEPTLLDRTELPAVCGNTPEPASCEIGLDLTLGPNPVRQAYGFPTVTVISDSET